jgi:hypothetical protein
VVGAGAKQSPNLPLPTLEKRCWRLIADAASPPVPWSSPDAFTCSQRVAAVHVARESKGSKPRFLT